MMEDIAKQEFYDKVLGCFLGKCIGGNIGAKYEGMKQRTDVDFPFEKVYETIPNDDLDLQVLWLDLLKKKGWDITGVDLAEIFYNNCPYAPGEYAFFKKNYAKSILPPLSGSFNNEFFCDGMGSPIRSEIWACLFYYRPEIAIKYAERDSRIDHKKKGVSEQAEVFLTALQCLCFYESGDAFETVKAALGYLPNNSALKKVIKDLLVWCSEEKDMEKIQSRILRKYGHSESCMAKQNTAILIASFLLKGKDFIGAITEALRCGFDADCTCATLGSIIGILSGGEKLKELFGIKDATYKLGVKSDRTDFSVSSLAREIVELSDKFRNQKLTDKRVYAEQRGEPVISFGGKKKIKIKVFLPESIAEANIRVKPDEPLYCKQTDFYVTKINNIVNFTVFLPKKDVLPEGVGGEIYYKNEKIGRFGLSVKRQFAVYGPFWKNEVVIPPLVDGLTYGKFIPKGKNRDEFMDHMRLFHLSCLPDDEHIKRLSDLNKEFYEIVEASTDIVKLSETSGFEGDSVYYYKTFFRIDHELETGLQIGCNVPLKVWLNDELLCDVTGNRTYYPEVAHKLNLKLSKGVNRLVFRVIKNNENAKFSYQFLKNGVCSDFHVFNVVSAKTGVDGEKKDYED